ncbi:MAG: carboxypeptidase regulatory-like domain-containing protein [Clostridia bacterium]|nr:carboxypeptidase regulatory-like domain-containing protein [Clostridia bacterium]
MREKTPQDYANELLRMYREAATEYELPTQNLLPQSDSENPIPSFDDGIGGLVVKATTLRGLYPVPNALVTVFSGDVLNKTVIESGITDQSGKSGLFKLKTQPKIDSLEANGSVPYTSYNLSVQSDGYVEQIAMNVPVFSGVVSVQNIDLLPISAAGGHTSPQIINEQNNYDL